MSQFRIWALGLFILSLGCRDSQSIKARPPAVRVVELMRERRCGEAKQLCDELLAREPRNTFLLLKRGEACMQLGEQEASSRAFEQVLQIDPRNQDAKFYLAKHEQPMLPLVTHREESREEINDDEQLTIPTSSSPAIVVAPPEFSVTSPPQRPAASTAYQQLVRGTLAARRQATEARILANLDQQLDPRAETPMDRVLPRQVVRADLGLEITVDMWPVAPMVTTGGRPSRILDEEEMPMRFGLVGQARAVPTMGNAPNRCFPDAGILSFEDRYIPTSTYKPQCADGKDNNGNLLIDRRDPACWQDPLDSNTYSPNSVESIGVSLEDAQIAAPAP